VATCIVGIGLLGVALSSSIPKLNTAKSDWFVNTPSTATALDGARSQIPPDAQVIASSAVSGALSQRKAIYAWYAVPQRFPITERPVYFVFVPQDPLQPVTKKSTAAAVAYTTGLPGAQLVFHQNGVTMVRWQPPTGIRSVVLPHPS
jgi:hypothetical protein